jgi:hypothetical protein
MPSSVAASGSTSRPGFQAGDIVRVTDAGTAAAAGREAVFLTSEETRPGIGIVSFFDSGPSPVPLDQLELVERPQPSPWINDPRD